MRLLLVRHGDPDYEIDGLTEAGKREAALLVPRLAPLPVKDYYVSPLGRARATAEPTLAAAGRTAEVCDWLREFAPRIIRPDSDHPYCCWDWLPADWTADPRFLDVDHWFDNERMQAGGVRQEYEWVTGELDKLLAEHGYVRDGRIYRVERPNEDTLVFFCHFGVSCVLLSHLLNVSPMVLWHGFCAAPGSVTTVTTEERRAGVASFRVNAFGDISHLYAAGVGPSFAARFCEVHGNGDRED
ncbi:MAG: histidine phosphatase family protein [Lachnospiraceae bacterium]|nr:histidine phosphatase family protein [Lachnospiraceae bacterium]